LHRSNLVILIVQTKSYFNYRKYHFKTFQLVLSNGPNKWSSKEMVFRVQVIDMKTKGPLSSCLKSVQTIEFTPPFLLESGVNFTNILWAAFKPADPESAKNTVKLSVFFGLLGSGRTKAARRMLVKLTPGVNPKECVKNYD